MQNMPKKNGMTRDMMHADICVDTRISDYETVSDSELVSRFKKGDETAFSSIVLKYRERLTRVACSILGNENDAMDISQEVFVKAYFNLKNFREDSSLYTWMYRILYNLCISSLRRKKIISFLSLDAFDEPKDIVSKMPDPGVEYERKEFSLAVEKALETLPLRQRMVFIMKQIDCLKHEEIAGIIGITEGAVKASYFQAVKKLQNLLKNYGEEYEMR